MRTTVHPVWPGSSALWAPPGGAALTIALFVVGQVLLVGFVWAKRAEQAADSGQASETEAPLGGRGGPALKPHGLLPREAERQIPLLFAASPAGEEPVMRFPAMMMTFTAYRIS